MREGLIEANPTIGTNVNVEVKRDRVLSDFELVEIWQVLRPDDYGDIVKLLILTACRRDEIADLAWSEVDFDQGLIVLPPERTKNRRRHVLPLPSVAIEVLKARPRSRDRAMVFGRGGRGYQNWSQRKDEADARIAEGRGGEMLARWTLHDLRRTAASGMAKLGTAPHVVECVLGHASGFRAGVAGTYNRYDYRAEMRQALALWAAHVLALLAGQPDNVVMLRVPA